MSKNVSRRKFLEIAAGGAAAVAVSACAITSPQEPTQDGATLIALFPKVGKADAIILSTGNSCVVVDTGTMAKGGAVAASPRYAIVTSSKDEREDDAVIDALEKVGAEVFLTRKGGVQATCDGASLMVLQG